MALEVAAIVAGLTGGYKLWSLVQDEVDLQAEEEDQDDELTATDASSSRPKKPKRNVEATVTVMVVGEAGVGKTLFCNRICSSTAGEPLPAYDGQTFAPSWMRAELDLQLDELDRRETRLCIHLLDTPGRAEFEPLVAPFYRQAAALILVFDVGSMASFLRVQSYWLAQVRAQRTQLTRSAAGTVVVLAHVVDELNERQVARRDASNWCLQNQLPYFETGPKDNAAWKRMLTHLARVCLGYASSQPPPGQPGQHERRGSVRQAEAPEQVDPQAPALSPPLE